MILLLVELFFLLWLFHIGLWTIRIPTIKRSNSNRLFRYWIHIMATFAIGSIIAMFFANKIIRNISSKIIIIYIWIVSMDYYGYQYLLLKFRNFYDYFFYIWPLLLSFLKYVLNLQASKI